MCQESRYYCHWPVTEQRLQFLVEIERSLYSIFHTPKINLQLSSNDQSFDGKDYTISFDSITEGIIDEGMLPLRVFGIALRFFTALVIKGNLCKDDVKIIYQIDIRQSL
ncbi:hypothetical protein M9H77_21252 [Catharanthus roseus]|uniref:Uncharacterized protein n=1 Tax=Catharanthus roseus TaxID=4058 RepID=A0ACC0AM70_CATRO|nr:hypothetical protein M9H77_21252 [Catharanthus roseus]